MQIRRVKNIEQEPVRTQKRTSNRSLYVRKDNENVQAEHKFLHLEPGCTCIAVASKGSFLGLRMLEFKNHAVTPVVRRLWQRFLTLPRRESYKAFKSFIRLFEGLTRP